jgi:hypothetical protein
MASPNTCVDTHLQEIVIFVGLHQNRRNTTTSASASATATTATRVRRGIREIKVMRVGLGLSDTGEGRLGAPGRRVGARRVVRGRVLKGS